MNYTRDGQPVTEVFANWDELLARLPELSAANGEIEIILLNYVSSGSAALEIPTGLTVVFDKGKGKNVLADIVNYGTLTIRGNSSSGSVSGKIENKEGGELVIESGYFKGTLENERTDGAGISVQSGLFNGADLIRSVSSYLAEGCCFTSMGASAKVGAAQAVAEVTDGGFALRFSTFALANTYGGYALEKTITITLLQDTSVGKLSVGSFASKAGATDWTIDLDGKTLTLTGDAGLAFGQKNYASTFTLRDGTVRSGNEGQTYLLTVDNGSKLIFESGTYYGGITRTNGTIDIREGCTFDDDIREFLTGGLTQNTAGTVVNPANAVVMIETADGIVDHYYTLQEALAAATDGDTVRLLSDVEPDEELTIGQAVTLDLNGHTIDSKYDVRSAINIESNGVKITDSTVSGSRADGQAGGTIIASTLALRISGYNDVTIEKIAHRVRHDRHPDRRRAGLLRHRRRRYDRGQKRHFRCRQLRQRQRCCAGSGSVHVQPTGSYEQPHYRRRLRRSRQRIESRHRHHDCRQRDYVHRCGEFPCSRQKDRYRRVPSAGRQPYDQRRHHDQRGLRVSKCARVR